MKRLLISIALVLFLSLPVRADMPELLTPGLFHGSEIAARSGDLWWCVIKTGDRFILKKEKVLIVPDFDEVIDSDSAKPTGKRVSVAGSEGVFMVKGVDNLVEGEVKTLPFKHPSGDGNLFVGPGHPLQLQLGNGSKYEVNLSNEGTLTITLGKRSQEFPGASYPGGFAYLVWAGDLDRDGKLDIVLNLSPEMNVGTITLFLSSRAGQNELLKKVAEFSTTGC